MKENYISLDTAKLAKEKGFGISVKSIYIETEEHTLEMGRGGDCTFPYMAPRILESAVLDKWDTEIAKAPTQSLLQKWLMDVHNIAVLVSFNDNNAFDFYYFIHTDISKPFSNRVCSLPFKFENYEQALEFGLQEALKMITIKQITS